MSSTLTALQNSTSPTLLTTTLPTTQCNTLLSFHSLVPFPFICGFLGCFFGYSLINSCIQLYYYKLRRDRKDEWKCQTETNAHDLHDTYYFHPLWQAARSFLFGDAPRRKNPPHFVFFTCLNIITASCFSGITAQLVVHPNPWTHLEYNACPSVTRIVCEFVALFLYQSIVEYWWHRLMHLRVFYDAFHRFHHYFKSPAPFDDLYVHPLEVLCYYIILYSPVVLFPTHLFSFILYMAYHGFTGCMDHSGVKFCIPKIYNSHEHDLHHKFVTVNYGFPSLLVDRIFGTHMLPQKEKQG